VSDLRGPIKSLKAALTVFEKDLEATPEPAYEDSIGGKARTVSDIAYEVALVNDHIGLKLRGEPLFDWPEGWVTAPEHLRAKGACIASFKESAARILQTVEGWSDEDLSVKLTTEHGETDRAERCRFMALHLWYHSGQINYIQTLLGDDDWHW